MICGMKISAFIIPLTAYKLNTYENARFHHLPPHPIKKIYASYDRQIWKQQQFSLLASPWHPICAHPDGILNNRYHSFSCAWSAPQSDFSAEISNFLHFLLAGVHPDRYHGPSSASRSPGLHPSDTGVHLGEILDPSRGSEEGCTNQSKIILKPNCYPISIHFKHFRAL